MPCHCRKGGKCGLADASCFRDTVALFVLLRARLTIAPSPPGEVYLMGEFDLSSHAEEHDNYVSHDAAHPVDVLSPVITGDHTGDKNVQLRGYKGLISCSADHSHLLEEPDVDASNATLSPIPESAPIGAAESVFSQLLTDWTRVIGQPAAQRELAQWRTMKPALSQVFEFPQLSALSYTDPDALFGALLALYQGGSPLAGQALVTLMVPKLRRLTRHARVSSGDPATRYRERASVTVCAFMEVIATFRGTGKSIPGSLSLQTLGALVKESPSIETIPVDAEFFATHESATHPATDYDEFADLSATGVLQWAVANKVISERDHTLITRAYLLEESADLVALAAEFGLTYPALRQRLHRGVKAVRNEVCDRMGVARPAAKRRYIHHTSRKSTPVLALAS